MTINIRQAKDYSMDEGIKVFLHGKSGAGKTAACCTAPRPLFILTEKNGLNTIRQFLPTAHIIEAKTFAEVREVTVAAAKGDLEGYRTLVYDSLTEIQRLMRDEIVAEAKKDTDDFTLKQWATLTERFRQFLRSIRNLEQNVVGTALSTEELEESTGHKLINPQFQGKAIPNEVAGYFSVVGYAFKRRKTDEKTQETTIEHLIMCDGPSSIMCKPCAPLQAIEQPNLTDWFERISGQPLYAKKAS